MEDLIKEAKEEYNKTHNATGEMSFQGYDDPYNAGFDYGYLRGLEMAQDAQTTDKEA